MRIKGLDGLRAIAFLLVFLYHAGWLPLGWMGVQLFFVLSGFLITGILVDMKATITGGAYFLKFYGRRFLRIFPLYYLYLLLIFLAAHSIFQPYFKPNYWSVFRDQFPYALGYIYNFYAASALYERTIVFFGHIWSLAVEEQFYLAWPLLIFLIPRRSYKSAFIIVVLLSISFRALVFLTNSAVLPVPFQMPPTREIYLMPFSHLDAFALGALLTVVQIRKAREKFLALLFALPVIAMVTDYFTTGTFGRISALGFPLYLASSYKSIWGYTALNYFFMVLIFGVARQGWFLRFLELKPIRYLGKISYGLYVYHYAIFWFITVPFNVPNQGTLPIATVFAAFASTVAVASLSFFLIEKPITDLKDRFFPIQPPQRFQPDEGAAR